MPAQLPDLVPSLFPAPDPALNIDPLAVCVMVLLSCLLQATTTVPACPPPCLLIPTETPWYLKVFQEKQKQTAVYKSAL